jgi:6-pyruvoyltetrahydropterin/6-carboxytetrahydropterin synthase
MYYVSKRLEIAFAHQLTLNYESKCQRLHGHNAIITVCCCAEELDENGMVVDFTHIKHLIADRFDHACLNELFDFNPTAENLARWICEQVPHCYQVSFQESEGNVAVYVKEGFPHPML